MEYLKIQMQKVFVSSYNFGGSHGDDNSNESVTLNFAKI